MTVENEMFVDVTAGDNDKLPLLDRVKGYNNDDYWPRGW